jgi:hypothetical protein
MQKDTNTEARPHPVIARRSPHPVIARRAAPWQSMPSRESAMDRFDLQPSHAGSQHGQDPGFIQVERLLQHRPRKAKNRWRKRFGREIGMGSGARSLRPSELDGQFSQPLQIALSHCRAFSRGPGRQILRQIRVKWPSLHLQQHAASFQCDHGMPSVACHLSTNSQVTSIFLGTKTQNAYDRTLIIKRYQGHRPTNRD